MSATKRFTISFKDTDIDLVRFFNSQQNASLTIRYLCNQWIARNGIADVIDFSATHFSENNSEDNQEPISNQENNLANDNKDSVTGDAMKASDDDFFDEDFDIS